MRDTPCQRLSYRKACIFAPILVFGSIVTLGIHFRIHGIRIPTFSWQQDTIGTIHQWYGRGNVDINTFDETYGEVHSFDEIGKQSIADLSKLSAEVQNKIWLRQNPTNCGDVQFLVLDLDTLLWGFGSQLHTIVMHFLQAFYTNRTFVIRSKGWNYDKKGGWDHYLMPLGNCEYNGNIKSIPMLSAVKSEVRIVKTDRDSYAKYGWTIPRNIYLTLKDKHSNPYAWWIGQFVKYIFQFQPWFQKKLHEKSRLINFTVSTVGLQIRWGDKIGREATKHSVDEYMSFTKRWYEKENAQANRSVYVATEQAEAWKDLEDRYQNYTFIGGGFVDRSKELEFQKQTNYASRTNELEAILTDLYFLSKCRYVVCTFSSNICRMLYEIAAVNNNEPLDRLQSVDEKIYWLYGLPKYMAIYDHTAEDREEVDLAIGDKFHPSRENFKPRIDGKLPGTNVRTGHKGRVPMYKLKLIVTPLDFDV